MVVSGLPERNGNQHVAEVANMAIDLLNVVKTRFRVAHRPDYKLQLRVGLHTGPCAAGEYLIEFTSTSLKFHQLAFRAFYKLFL